MKKVYFTAENFFDWFKGILPPFFFLIVLLLLGGFSLYKGQKHRRIISKLEDRFIDLTFSFSGPKERVVEDKIYFLKFKSYHSWAEKINIVQKVYKKAPEYFFIFNLDKEKGINNKAFEITALLKDGNNSSKVVFSSDPSFLKKFPKSFLDNFLVLEDDPCEGKRQRICVYNQKWKSWMGQFLFDQFGSGIKEKPISSNLQRVYPSYLLYFSQIRNVLTLGERKNSTENLDFLKDKIVLFDLSTASANENLEPGISYLFSSGSYKRGYFWHDLIQVFVDDDFVFVFGEVTTGLFLAISIFIILIFILFLESFFLFLAFFSFFFFLVFLNVFFVLYYRIYLPLSNIFFFDFAFASVFVFLKISYLSYRRDFELFSEKKIYEIKKFRKVVVSIVSHNLNTPLAQIQGLFDLAQNSSKKTKEHKKDLLLVEHSLGLSYLSIRVFLTLISIQNKRQTLRTSTLEEFFSFFKNESKNALRNIKVSVKPLYDKSSPLTGLYSSQSALSCLLLCFCYFFSKKEKPINLNFMMSCEDKSEFKYIFFNIISAESIGERFLSYERDRGLLEGEKSSFLERLIFHYIDNLKKIAEINFFYKETKDKYFTLSLRLSFKKK